jgi:enoyl-CoA hydratase/carnithine racemase
MSDLHIRQRNDILWLILDRNPQNLLTVAMLEQLLAALLKAIKKPPRLIVLTGMGEEAFCAGIDPLAMSPAQREELGRLADQIDEAVAKLHALNISTVAVVKGATLGAGCELAVLCRLRFARDDTTFQFPPSAERLFQRSVLATLSPLPKKEEAYHLVESAERFTVQEALRLGMIDQLLSAKRFLQDTEELLTMLVATV